MRINFVHLAIYFLLQIDDSAVVNFKVTISKALNRPIQLLNLTINATGIDNCQVLRYINHQNHKHACSHAPHDQNDKHDRCIA